MKRSKHIYYIIENLASEDNLSENGASILRVKRNSPKLNYEQYDTVRELKKKSAVYNNLIKTNPERAIKICKPENIFKAADYILTPSNSEFDNVSYKILSHSLKGKIAKNNLTGIHILNKHNENKIRIVERIDSPNSKGVYKAKISIYDEKKDKWIKKYKPSTFFPEDWTLSRLMVECFFAFMNKNRIGRFKFSGYTLSRIPVEIIINETGELKSIYPIMSNNS